MARMKRQATLLIVILLSLCIPSLSQAQGTPNYNEWVIAEFPVVNSEVKNAGDYYTWIVPLNLPQTSSIPAYVTNWMEIDAGPASSLLSNFMQVGLITTNAGVQWFFATDPEVDPYTYVVECPISGTEAWHNSQNQPRGCLGNPGDFGLDVNIWSRVQLVTYGQGFWIARVTDINGNKHDIAKIYNWYTYASRATVAFEESWIATWGFLHKPTKNTIPELRSKIAKDGALRNIQGNSNLFGTETLIL